MNKPHFTRSLETDLIIGRLREATPENPIVTEEELSKIIGRDVRNGAQHYLYTARTRLEHDEGKFFIRVRGQKAIKLAEPKDRVAYGMDKLSHIQRTSNRGLRVLGKTDIGKLDNRELVQFNTTASCLGVLSHFSKVPTLKRIEAAVTGAREKLAIGRVLEVIRPS